MTTSEFREEFFALADQANHIVITSHSSPDDDSIGSVLSVYSLLRTEYPEKTIRIVYTGAAVDRYNSFHNFNAIEWVDDIANHIDGADMLIGLDASKFLRYSRLPETLQAVPVTIAIDHHASTPDHYTLLLVDTSCTSNCELLYKIFFEDQTLIKEIAECILLGILGDTGGFAFVPPEQSSVFALAGKLVATVGVSIDLFRSRYMGIPVRVIPLLQALVANALYRADTAWPAFQYTYIPRTLVHEGGYTDEDISAASHIYIGQYLPKVQGYTWGFVVTPRIDGMCRMSTRSLATSVNVRDLCERMGVGGGHDGASGATFPDADPAVCIAKVLDFLKANTPVLR